MKLKREYKQGTKIQFKWYNDWRDEFEHPYNFKLVEGTVQENTFLNEVIAYDEKENKYYAVPNENVISEI